MMYVFLCNVDMTIDCWHVVLIVAVVATDEQDYWDQRGINDDWAGKQDRTFMYTKKTYW